MWARAPVPERDCLSFLSFPFGVGDVRHCLDVVRFKVRTAAPSGSRPWWLNLTLCTGGRAGASVYPGPTSSEGIIVMIVARCLLFPVSYRGSYCYPVLAGCRVVVVLAVLVLAVVFALHGYPPETVTGPVLVLVVGVVGATDRLVGIARTRSVLGSAVR